MAGGSSHLRWIAREDGRVLADPVRVADSYWKRLIGLAFRRGMAEGEALWLKDCGSIHTAWMRFAIDVFFLDESLRVVDARFNVPPWRIVRTRSTTARHVVEIQTTRRSTAITEGLETEFPAADAPDS